MASFHQIVAKAIEAAKSAEEVSLQESEEKFISLALAFNTDRQTLDRRIELHLRARDIAEQNIQKELECLKDGLKLLNQSCSSSRQSDEVFATIQTHVDVLEKSIARMSSRAELHGAVQQELRVSQVIETMLEHVENLKRSYDTEHRELQEAKNSQNETKQDGTETSGSSKVMERTNLGGVGPGKGSLRRISLALMAKNPKQPRLTSLQMSDSYSTSSAAPSLQSPSLLFSEDNLVNSCSGAIFSKGSSRHPQLSRQNRYGSTTRYDESDSEDVKRKDKTTRDGDTSKKDGDMDDSTVLEPNCHLGLKKEASSQYHRELQNHFLTWLVPLLRLLLQSSSNVSIRKGYSFMLGMISKFQLLKISSPGIIVIVMFSMSATVLLVIVWTRWM